jgi:hypothetical protein
MGIPTNAPTNAPTSSPAKSARATGMISFRVPIAGKAKIELAKLGRQPQYVSPATATATFYFDSTALTFSTSNPPTTAQSIGATGSGQTATITEVAAADYYQVTVALTVVAGSHQIGVLTEDATPFVLSEAQGSYSFAAGTNADMSLVLNGVLASGYICDAACDGGVGTATTAPDGGASYALTAVPADADGFLIPDQTGLPFDNGNYSVVAVTTSGTSPIIAITNAGPYNTPGTDQTYGSNGSLGGPTGSFESGHNFSIECVGVGSANIEMQLGATGNTPLDPFASFTYTSSNYPTAGEVLVGNNSTAANGTGFSASVSCSATGNLVIS